MNEQLIASLEELGLSEKESRVYLANLMIGPASVQKIADQANIKRVTTYVILEALINLGLASQSTKGKKTFFTAEEPISLRRLLERKQQQVADQKQHFEELLPELNQLKGLPVETPSVKFYDSAEGIRSIMSNFMSQHRKEGDVGYGFSNTDQIFAFFPEIASFGGNPDRAKSGIHSKLIYTSSIGQIYRGKDEERNRESRLVPLDKFPFDGDITILGNHIVMLSLTGSKPIGVTINSAELAKAFKAVFALAWEAAEKYNK